MAIAYLETKYYITCMQVIYHRMANFRMICENIRLFGRCRRNFVENA